MEQIGRLLQALALATAKADLTAVAAVAGQLARLLNQVVGPGGEAEGDEALTLMGRQLAVLSVAVITGDMSTMAAITAAAKELAAYEAECLHDAEARMREELIQKISKVSTTIEAYEQFLAGEAEVRAVHAQLQKKLERAGIPDLLDSNEIEKSWIRTREMEPHLEALRIQRGQLQALLESLERGR